MSYLVKPLSADVLAKVFVVEACSQKIPERSHGSLQAVRSCLLLGLGGSKKSRLTMTSQCIVPRP
jgi:hypothetical protein